MVTTSIPDGCGFIDCTSLSFTYDIMGRVVVSYTTVHRSPDFCYTDIIDAGGQTFDGDVTSMSLNQIVGTSGWYETHVTLITTTN
jgi:hypothetical protein